MILSWFIVGFVCGAIYLFVTFFIENEDITVETLSLLLILIICGWLSGLAMAIWFILGVLAKHSSKVLIKRRGKP